MNQAPIVWFLKCQNTVESSTYGSEFITLKTAIDLIEALHYKLHMFGIAFGGLMSICPTNIFCDNEEVVLNTTHSESTIKRKHTYIAYHWCQEAEAARYVHVGFIKGNENPADVLTKLLPGPKL